MLLVDTNVVAYLLIEGDCTEAAQELRTVILIGAAKLSCSLNSQMFSSSIARKRMTLSMAEDFLAKAAALFDGKLGRIPTHRCWQSPLAIESAPMMRGSSPWQINSGAVLSLKTPDCAPPRPP